MLLDIAKPAALLLAILSLYSVFHAAFLSPADLQDRLHEALLRLALAAAISTLAGLLFREGALEYESRFDEEFHAWFGGQPQRLPAPPLRNTLPMQLFCWASAGMVVLFAISWYIETYVILYRDTRY